MKRDSKELQDAIDMLIAYRDGAEVEYRSCNEFEYKHVPKPEFNNRLSRYRIKPREWWLCWDEPNRQHIYSSPSYDDCLSHWEHCVKVREIIE